MNKLIYAYIFIVGVGIASYFLYMYNYNKAKDAMSLVMPDFMLAYAQQQEDIIIPSRETHGDILLIAAVDMLDFGECSKNKNNYNSEAAEACLNRPRILKKYLN